MYEDVARMFIVVWSSLRIITVRGRDASYMIKGNMGEGTQPSVPF